MSLLLSREWGEKNEYPVERCFRQQVKLHSRRVYSYKRNLSFRYRLLFGQRIFSDSLWGDALGGLEPDHVDTESRSGETEGLASRNVTGSRYHRVRLCRSVACTLGAGQLL